MKSALAVVLLGLAALIVQGALARTFPPPWCPDLAWLVVVGVGLRWPGFLSGLLVALGLGFAADLVSGSLMGQHALMRLVTFFAAAVAARQLDLSGGVPITIFVFGMTFVYGLAIVSTLSFFVGSGGIGLDFFGSATAFAIVNVLAAGPMIVLVERVLARFSDEEAARRAPLPIGYRPRGSLG
ncbi:MAG: hypothetical protein CL908_02485 [Deltaproteobacteria bacterium]|nr:hypothetical protein [Deltaproteobacteria bacterium]